MHRSKTKLKRYCSREMSAALKEKSAKVIEWLKTAEEETESEEV